MEAFILQHLNIEIPKTLWKHPLYSNPEYGSEYLTNMLGSSAFETPKSYHTIMQFLIMTGGNGVYLDYFGGSGTTAQAVLELNKLDEEDGHRKYLIVEMGDYFYSVLLPRLKKLCISSKWKKQNHKIRMACLNFLNTTSLSNTRKR